MQSAQTKMKLDHDRDRALDLGNRLNDDLQRRISACNDATMRTALQAMLGDLIELQRLASLGATVEIEQPRVAEAIHRQHIAEKEPRKTARTRIHAAQMEANHG